MSDAHGFPWGSNRPSRRQRLFVALAIAAMSCAHLYVAGVRYGTYRTDFSLIRFGGEALLHGADPYALAGHGRVFDSQWPALYPATAYVLGIPFALVSERWASLIFVGLSVFALAYGATRDSWHRLPLFPSVAFIWSVQVAQWSMLFTAALFLPWLGAVLPAKPQAALPIIAGSTSARTIWTAASSALVLIAASLMLLPTWPAQWISLARDANQLIAPVAQSGGFIILLVLLRWRRADAWLIAWLALMPQTWYPYNILPLLALPSTYREACVLSLVSSVGVLAAGFLTTDIHSLETARVGGTIVVATAYLPAVIMVLRRPNEGPMPAWLASGRMIRGLWRRSDGKGKYLGDRRDR